MSVCLSVCLYAPHFEGPQALQNGVIGPETGAPQNLDFDALWPATVKFYFFY